MFFTFDPMANVASPDRVWFLDASVESTRAAGSAGGPRGEGFFAGPAANNLGPAHLAERMRPWGKYVSAVPGRFHPGVHLTNKNLANAYQPVWMPCEGLLGPAFRITWWMKADRDWDHPDLRDKMVWQIGGGGGAGSAVKILCRFSDGATMDVNFTSNIGRRSGPAARFGFAAKPPKAGEWVNVCYVSDGSQAWLYVNGKEVAHPLSVARPQFVDSQGADDGIVLLGEDGSGSRSNPFVTLSDFEVARRPLKPGDRLASDAPADAMAGTLTVPFVPAAGGPRVNDLLPGALHIAPTADGVPFEGKPGLGKSAPGLVGKVKVVRTDKALGACAVKEGGPGKDANGIPCPTPGHSGRYSYNWTALDRTVRWFRDAGARYYLSLDTAPQLLGGPTRPWTEEEAARRYLFAYEWSVPHVPNDPDKFAVMCADLVWHLEHELGTPPEWCTVWNEPDTEAGGGFWAGDAAGYSTLFRKVSAAVKRVAPGMRMGAVEAASYLSPSALAYVERVIADCAGPNEGLLDIVAAHHFDNDANSITWLRERVDGFRASHGFSRPLSLVNGEGLWGFGYQYGGMAPWVHDDNPFIASWSAVKLAHALVQSQRVGTLTYCFQNLSSGRGDNHSGLTDANGSRIWANGNVFVLWDRLGKGVLQSATLDAAPGLDVQVSYDVDRRRHSVFAVNETWRTDPEFDRTVTISNLRPGAVVTAFTVSKSAGSASESQSSPNVSPVNAGKVAPDGRFTYVFPARSVTLLEIEPPVRPAKPDIDLQPRPARRAGSSRRR